MIDGQHSEPNPVVSGVPQGSVLGPILFIIYINDLHDIVKNCKTGSFADDTKLKGKIDIAEDTLDVQEDLNSVIAWSMKNNMSLHEDKFIYLRNCTNKSTLLNELPFTILYKSALPWNSVYRSILERPNSDLTIIRYKVNNTSSHSNVHKSHITDNMNLS